MNAYHAELIDHLTHPAPPGYSQVSLTQVLRADRAAFMLMSERLTTLRKDAAGKTPLEKELASVLNHSSVSFHLLPLARGQVQPSPKQPAKPSAPKPGTKRPKSESPTPAAPKAKAKGAGKGKKKRGRGPNVPEQLINKAKETKDGRRLCWAFNLPGGCNKAPPGGTCERGAHLCAEVNCQKAHSMQEHASS